MTCTVYYVLSNNFVFDVVSRSQTILRNYSCAIVLLSQLCVVFYLAIIIILFVAVKNENDQTKAWQQQTILIYCARQHCK